MLVKFKVFGMSVFFQIFGDFKTVTVIPALHRSLTYKSFCTYILIFVVSFYIQYVIYNL